VNLPCGDFDECASWLVQPNQESRMITTGKPRRTLIAASFLGIAMALAVTSSAQAQNHQMVAQPSTGHGSSTRDSDGSESGYRYAGVLSHALPYLSGQSQSQGLQPSGHPAPPRRNNKPPL
jgi:hypothetical protein